MGEFVGDDRGHTPPPTLGGRRRIDEQRLLAEGDEAGVLHGTRRKLEQGSGVELREGERNAEVPLEDGDDLGVHPQAFLEQRPATLGRHPTQGHRRLRSLQKIALAHVEGDEIGRKGPCRLEPHRLPSLTSLLLRRGGRIGEGDHRPRHGQADLEGRLEAGLVEAGEGLARVGHLELRVGVPPRTVGRPVQAGEMRIEGRCPHGMDHRRTFGERLGEADEDPARIRRGHLGRDAFHPGLHPPSGLFHPQGERLHRRRMEIEAVGLALHREIDLALPLKGLLCGIDGEVQTVGGRADQVVGKLGLGQSGRGRGRRGRRWGGGRPGRGSRATGCKE